jgi:hypothetical protein
MVLERVAEGTGVGAGSVGVTVGTSVTAERGDLLVKLGADRVHMEEGRSDSACPIFRQSQSTPESPMGHVISNRDLMRPSIETIRATMHATEDAIISRSLHPGERLRSEPLLIRSFPHPLSYFG